MSPHRLPLLRRPAPRPPLGQRRAVGEVIAVFHAEVQSPAHEHTLPGIPEVTEQGVVTEEVTPVAEVATDTTLVFQ